MNIIFDEKNYNFTDSIITEFKLDNNLRDLLVIVDYYLGEDASKILTIRLKNIKEFVFHNSNIQESNDVFSSLTISHISKKIIKNNIQLIIESALSYLPGHENDKPIITCICENVFVED